MTAITDSDLARLRSRLTPRTIALALCVATVATLAACGSGGGTPTPSPTPSPTPAPAPTPTPIPTPPPASADLALSLLSGTGGTAVPFTVGQALRQGDVPQGSTVLAGNVAGFQAAIRNRWPDGSAKYAVLSGRVDLTANTWRSLALAVAAEPAPQPALATAELKATGVTASVQFSPYGTAAWSGSDWDAPAQSLVSGPEMSSWTYRKPIGSDAHLVAWLEVRAYRGGQVEVLPWIENGYLRVAGPTAKPGTATFTLGGTQRFSQPLDLLNHQRAVLASGTTLTHWLGTDPQLTARHGTAYLMASKLVPSYRGVTAAGSPLFNRQATRYTPLAQADFPDAMGSAGYDRSIGLLPEWDVAYLTSGGDPRAWRTVLINGYAAGRYGIHFRDETTHRPMRFSSYPTLVLGNGSGVSAIGGSTTNSYTPNATGASPPNYTNSHHPSMGYMAYLLSGWHYYLEETQFLATVHYLKQSDNIRKTTQGVLETSTGANTTRGAAWALRTLAQAAALTPDGDPLRTEFVNSVTANVNHYHGRYIATTGNQLGLVHPYSDYEPGNGAWQSAMWMDDFFTGAFGYLKELQAHDTSVTGKLDAFLEWKYRSVIGRLGGSGTGAYSYRQAAQYTLNYAPSESADWTGGTGPWYATWGEVARSMNLPTEGEPGQSLDTGYPTDPKGYWGNLMPALAYAVDHGATGSAEAWNRVVSASNFPAQAAGYDDDPVWGVKPRTR